MQIDPPYGRQRPELAMRSAVGALAAEIPSGKPSTIFSLARELGRTRGRDLSGGEVMLLLDRITRDAKICAYATGAPPTVDDIAAVVCRFLDELDAAHPARTSARYASFLAVDVAAVIAAVTAAVGRAAGPRVPIAMIAVDGGPPMTLEVPADQMTPAAVNAAIADLGLEGRLYCPTAEEIEGRRREDARVQPFVEEGRKSYRDAFNPNGPDAPAVCPHPEGSTQAAAWWMGWNAEAAADAPDSC